MLSLCGIHVNKHSRFEEFWTRFVLIPEAPNVPNDSLTLFHCPEAETCDGLASCSIQALDKLNLHYFICLSVALVYEYQRSLLACHLHNSELGYFSYIINNIFIISSEIRNWCSCLLWGGHHFLHLCFQNYTSSSCNLAIFAMF